MAGRVIANAGRTFVAALLSAAIGMTVFGLGSGAAADVRTKQTTAKPEKPVVLSASQTIRVPGLPRGAREVLNERTRTSRTYLTNDSRLTMAYPGSINYRDASDRWRPINDTLVPSSQAGYAFTEKANAYRLRLPSRLGSRPVRIGSGKAWLSFALRGAHGQARTKGATATYPDALPATNVSYTASADGVKEALTLRNPAAPRSFSYDLALNSGLSAKQLANGAIVVRNTSGRLVFGIQAPYMYDRAGASARVGARLERTQSGYLLSLRPSAAWLQSSKRAWPVTIDPTTDTYSSGRACYLASNTPTTSFCNGLTLKLGYDGANKYRPVLQFDVSGLDHSSVVLNAELGLYIQSKTTANVAPIGVYQLTRPWFQASWNNADTGVPWTAPGGDFASTAAATNSAVGASTGAFRLYPTQLVQQWVNDPSTNDGLLLKQTSENVSNVLTLGGTDPSVPADQMPYLAVTTVFAQGGWVDTRWLPASSSTITSGCR